MEGIPMNLRTGKSAYTPPEERVHTTPTEGLVTLQWAMPVDWENTATAILQALNDGAEGLALEQRPNAHVLTFTLPRTVAEHNGWDYEAEEVG
jgi:hypothetical protein